MDSSWAYTHRTRLRWLLGSIGFIIFAAYITTGMYVPPTCSDNKRNQDEVGTDCGGVCSYYCTSQVQETNTVWTRAFEVSPGWWSALAYIENPNFDKYADRTPYRFSFYDEAGALLLKREGRAYLYRDPLVVVFEGRLPLEAVPYRTVFEWLEPPQWRKAPRAYDVMFEQQKLVNVKEGHELFVTIQNREPVALEDVEVVAIVYDDQQNAIAASQTYIDVLGPRIKKRIVFSWPLSFSGTVGRIEFLPRIPVQN